ncbi:MAG: alpha/beta hydrolase fold protein [Verrucomicrobia bacterium]|nr:alpha/beta hydrolase fold protein [Verrucomicrobiota bacterium]
MTTKTHRRRALTQAGWALIGLAWVAPLAAVEPPSVWRWQQLLPLPDPHGFASPFVGVSGDALIVAGGSNFPGKQLWEGGAKTWHDRIFVLEAGATRWELAGKLPTPLAYGLAVSTPDGVVCAGGGNAEKNSTAVFLLRYQGGHTTFQDLPSLPAPVAMGAGALVGNMLYLAGGLESPTSTEPLSSFLALDLKNPSAGWQALPSWPGPGRSQAVAASAGGYFYLFSGIRFETKADGTRGLVYLKDAYRYSPEAHWEKLPDLPFPAAAGASPAPTDVAGRIFLVGGVDGSAVGVSPEEFRSAPQRIQEYSASTRAWRAAGNAPEGRVGVSTTQWRGAWVLPSGERSAGVRSPEMWLATISSPSSGAGLQSASALAPPPTVANVAYGRDEHQILDFWQAPSKEPTPLVLFIHGGSWLNGDKTELTRYDYAGDVAKYLAAGISVVSINYRFVSQAFAAGVKPPVQWPMQDAARALQFIRSKAGEWHLDKKRIALSGGSAGACSALWLAMHDDLANENSGDPVERESTRVWCAAVLSAQTTLDPRQMVEWTPNSVYGGHAFGFMSRPDDAKTARRPFAEFLAARETILPWIKEYSPFEQASPGDPPIYLIYLKPPMLGRNQEDPTHTVNFGVKLEERLRAVGVECELVYPGAPNVKHPAIQDYLIEKLKTPQGAKSL